MKRYLHINGKGDLFPLSYCLQNENHVDAFYASLCRTEVVRIPINDFVKQLETEPCYALQILKWYSKEMGHIILRLKDQGKSSAKQKLLGTLSYLGEEHSAISRSGTDWSRISFPMSQQTLADITGLTRETVNATLKEIEGLQVVRMPRKSTLDINRTKLDKIIEDI